MNKMEQFAFNMLQNNPNVQNKAMAKAFMEILQSGDTAKGEQLANNILNTYGLKKEDALKQAQQSIKWPF